MYSFKCPICESSLAFLTGYPAHHNNLYCTNIKCRWEAWNKKTFLVKQSSNSISW